METKISVLLADPGDTSRMFVVGKPTIAGKRLVDLAFGTM